MSEMLRAGVTGRPVKVDREKNVLRGYVVAQLGRFKSSGRGEFDLEGLLLVETLSNERKQGLKSRLNHATACDSGIGNHLGRSRGFFMSECLNSVGETVPCVRADLFMDATAMDTPLNGGKPLGQYVLDLAESDPDALSSSLVLEPKKVYRKNSDGTRMTDSKGEELPPLWYAQKIWNSDIVDTGDAVDGLLSFDGLQHDQLWKGTELLDGMFDGMSRDEVKDRLMPWVDRYLNHRFGEIELSMGDMLGLYAIGDRVTVKSGEEHDEGHQGPGTVKEIGTAALGIEFDDEPGEIHHWYVAAEVDPVSGTAPEAMSAMGATDVALRVRRMRNRDLQLVK